MKLGIDLDGVVVDFHRWFIEDFNDRNHTNLTLADWTDYEFTNAGFNRDSINEYILNQAKKGEFILPGEIPNASETLQKLHKKNSIHVITYRSDRAKESAITWLEARGVPYDSISFTKDKARIAYLLNIDVMIEDDVNQSKAVAGVGIETLLYDRPYNQSVQSVPLIQRVKNWDEILNILT